MVWLKVDLVPQDLLDHLDEMDVKVQTLNNDEETLYFRYINVYSTIIFKIISQGILEYQEHQHSKENQEVNVHMFTHLFQLQKTPWTSFIFCSTQTQFFFYKFSNPIHFWVNEIFNIEPLLYYQMRFSRAKLFRNPCISSCCLQYQEQLQLGPKGGLVPQDLLVHLALRVILVDPILLQTIVVTSWSICRVSTCSLGWSHSCSWRSFSHECVTSFPQVIAWGSICLVFRGHLVHLGFQCL